MHSQSSITANHNNSNSTLGTTSNVLTFFGSLTFGILSFLAPDTANFLGYQLLESLIGLFWLAIGYLPLASMTTVDACCGWNSLGITIVAAVATGMLMGAAVVVFVQRHRLIAAQWRASASAEA